MSVLSFFKIDLLPLISAMTFNLYLEYFCPQLYDFCRKFLALDYKLDSVSNDTEYQNAGQPEGGEPHPF